MRLEPPKFRQLKVYAFDPIFSRRMDTSSVSEIVLEVPWESSNEPDPQDLLQPGPIGDYVEVIDYDPASECFYDPVDLNHPWLISRKGHTPSEANPQFHQQMVYAVAMQTIRAFEVALGRCILWAPRLFGDNGGFVRRLRLYPHALREANAFYSPEKKAILFGYTPATGDVEPHGQGKGIVFTCLSQDVIAHEVSHAILDGMHRRFIEASNPDVLAFHEAFADIVALFQHFSLPGVLDHQIAQTRGDLTQQNLLGQLAYQLGRTIGNRGALRDALGSFHARTGQWQPKRPDPQLLQTTFEPHRRGSILVAALFASFLKIYDGRTRDLMRIATGGTGILPNGDIHPDLVQRLSREARTSAGHMLRMCIRALDYCPPVDITFGDYLRALITADVVMVPEDPHCYRTALIESFEQWGIYPEKVRSLSQDSLCWNSPNPEQARRLNRFFHIDPRLGGGPIKRSLESDWNLRTDREKVFSQMQSNAKKIHDWFTGDLQYQPGIQQIGKLLGLELHQSAPRTVKRRRRSDPPTFEVHSVRWASRQSPDGDFVTDLIIEVTQQRRGYYDPQYQRIADQTPLDRPIRKQDFWFRGGCTLIISAETGAFRYIIQRGVGSRDRLERQRQFRAQGRSGLAATYESVDEAPDEPFAFLHRF